MRSLLLIIAAVVVAAAGFTAYLWWQDPGTTTTVSGGGLNPLSPTTLQSTGSGVAGVGLGKGIVVKQLSKDGEVTSIFRAQEYVPRETKGVADVITPEFEFFLGGGRRLVLGGDRGTINLEERQGRNATASELSGGTAAPSSGQLYNVSIKLFEPAIDRPTLTLETNNVSFDNQTFKIVTESYSDAAGKTIAADNVPVTIRGDDVDFDGRGLVVRYDDLNQRVALLLIAHGERVVLKRPSMMTQGTKNPGEKASKPPAPVESPPVANGSMPSTDGAATQPSPLPAYRATLSSAVRITQGDKPMAEADSVSIDFRPDESKKPATTQPTVKNGVTTAAATPPATVPVQAVATAPATKPAEEPIVIRWNGPLRLVALETQTVVPLRPGDAAITAVGTPLVLHQPQGTVLCASMLMRTADGAVTFNNGESAPRVVFTDVKGETTLTSTQVDYSDATKTAILLGSSTLRMKPPAKSTTQPATELAATWDERCQVKLADDGSGGVRQIDISGHVKVDHPQLKLKSDSLALSFEPDAKDKTKSNLRWITAAGKVDADLSDPQNSGRRVRAAKLVVSTATLQDGSVFPQIVDAGGSVNAEDGEQSLLAERVQIVMKPKPATRPATSPASTTRPVGELAAAELAAFTAEGAVVLKSKDAGAKADRVAVTMERGQPTFELIGTPAELTQQGRTITGPSIYARPDDGYAMIDGAGSLHAPGSATTRPADLTWAGSAKLEASKNLITFRDQINVKTKDADGSVVTATGDELIVTLKNAPTTKPVTRPALAKPQAAESDALKDKAIASVALAGKAQVQSNLLTPEGGLLKRTVLLSERVVVNFDEQQQFAGLDIPAAGQALHEDYRPQKDGDKPPGAIAVSWQKSLRLDQKPEPLATLSGGVKITHLGAADLPESDRMMMEASRVRISFVPTPPGATTRPTTRLAVTRPATGPTTRPTSFALSVRHVSADAPVTFTARDTKVIAQSLQYTPAQHLIVLIGNERLPVEWWNGKNESRGTFTELWFNTQDQTMIMKSPRLLGR